MSRFAVRHLLPLEMSVALLSSLPIGVSSWVGHGVLWEILHAYPAFMGLAHNVWWGAAFTACGAGLLAASLCEWRAGRYWEGERLRRVAAVRFWFAMLLAVCHMALAWLLISTGRAVDVFSIAAATPVAVLLLVWSAWKLACLLIVLDPRIESGHIERIWSGQKW